MKTFTVSILAAFSIAAASAQSLRGDFETDVVDTARRELQNCVANSSYLGCFRDRNLNRAMPHQVDGKFHTAEVCESACTGMGFTHFGLQWKGQCFCSNDSDYDKHGSTSGCDCCAPSGENVGGGKMCVWMAGTAAPGCDGNGSPGAPYLGCYEDKNRDRAMPHRVSGRRHSAKDCQDECGKKGMKYFGRQWRGQCFCSNDSDYGKHGSASNCDCCGSNVGGGKMCVWAA